MVAISWTLPAVFHVEKQSQLASISAVRSLGGARYKTLLRLLGRFGLPEIYLARKITRAIGEKINTLWRLKRGFPHNNGSISIGNGKTRRPVIFAKKAIKHMANQWNH